MNDAKTVIKTIESALYDLERALPENRKVQIQIAIIERALEKLDQVEK